ncbi:hypothetical protein DGG96_14605 [Legionella qingyii]|uniref:Uncharacterized protein n=1 Tax=Legionella qingyii TaxID=2184757 RepID=A0A317U336_9GAMM|nr:hypothetical protein DGG96_14605 [Legionella qingyii]
MATINRPCNKGVIRQDIFFNGGLLVGEVRDKEITRTARGEINFLAYSLLSERPILPRRPQPFLANASKDVRSQGLFLLLAIWDFAAIIIGRSNISMGCE